MDSEYWSVRFERLGEDFALQMLKAEGIADFSDETRVQWGSEMKDIGNNYFRRGDVDSATLIYETIVDGLVPNLPDEGVRFDKYVNLIVSCYLNMAACLLKEEEYMRVITLCTEIVLYDDKCAKGFYRRGLAYTKIGDFTAALLDFQRAHILAPHDKNIALEISKLFEANKMEGDNGRSEITQSGSEGVRKIIDNNSLSAEEGPKAFKGCDMVIDQDNITDEVDVTADPSNVAGVNQRIRKEGVKISCNFVNKKRPSSQLRISSSDMEKLMMGKDLQFQHPKSCVMRVRALSSKLSTLSETLHDTCSWEAVVSNDTSVPLGKAKTLPPQDVEDIMMDENLSNNNVDSSERQGTSNCSTFVFSSSAQSSLPATKNHVKKNKLVECCAAVGDKRKFAARESSKDLVCLRSRCTQVQPSLTFSPGMIHKYIHKRTTTMRLSQRQKFRKFAITRRMTNHTYSCRVSTGLKRKVMSLGDISMFCVRKRQCLITLYSFSFKSTITLGSDIRGSL